MLPFLSPTYDRIVLDDPSFLYTAENSRMVSAVFSPLLLKTRRFCLHVKVRHHRRTRHFYAFHCTYAVGKTGLQMAVGYGRSVPRGQIIRTRLHSNQLNVPGRLQNLHAAGTAAESSSLCQSVELH